MIKETTNYYCDKCEKEMTSYEYLHLAPKFTISINLPSPNGKCGEIASASSMTLCTDCCEQFEFKNTEGYHGYTNSHTRLASFMSGCKFKLLEMFKGKVKF